MKNIQRIIRCYFGIIAIFFIASTASLQAQTDYTGGDLTIDSDANVPSNVTEITRIDGALSISGTITSFPNFAALTVVTGFFSVNNLADGSPTTLTNIFPLLEEVKGEFSISFNSHVQTITGFVSLRTVGGGFSISNNDNLQTISGFGALENAGTFFELRGNPALSSCCAFLRIANGVIPSGFKDFRFNKTGCNSPGEISNNCTFTIDDDTDVAPTTLVRIEGILNIGGSITSFPDFSVLEVVAGDLIIRGLTDGSLTSLDNIFPNLTEVQGNLTIEDNANVTTLTGFGKLEIIRGSLIIAAFTGNFGITGPGNAFTSLPDFAALTSIGRDLFIDSNDNLATFTGFSVLATIGRDLRIGEEFGGNMELTTIPGFVALTSIGRNLFINNNAKLVTFTGFDVLTSIGGDFRIVGNSALTSVSGFSKLATIGFNMIIGLIREDNFGNIRIIGDGNPVLATIPDFAVLTSIGENLSIQKNDKLTTIPPFVQLSSIGKSLVISENDKLTSIPGFDLLATIGRDLSIGTRAIPPEYPGGASFPIFGNPLITGLPAFPSLTSITGNLDVVANIALTDLSTFNALTTLGGDLYIEGNDRTGDPLGF